jgi:hypothetical protein
MGGGKRDTVQDRSMQFIVILRELCRSARKASGEVEGSMREERMGNDQLL